MSIASFAPSEKKTGTGSVNSYTFSFYAPSKEDIEVIEYDENGVEQNRVTGDDTATLISSLTFNNNNMGGTINLQSNLGNNHELYINLAPDEPIQESSFKTQGSFTRAAFESALDYLAAALQRVAWLSQRSVRLPSSVSTANFDAKLPVDIAQAGYVLQTNNNGDGWSAVSGATTITGLQPNVIAFYSSPTMVTGSSSISVISSFKPEYEFVTGNGADADSVTLANGYYIGQIKTLHNPSSNSFYVEVEGFKIRPGYTATYRYVATATWVLENRSH